MEVTLANSNVHNMLYLAGQPFAFSQLAVRTEPPRGMRRFAAEMRHAAVVGPVKAFLDGCTATGWVHRNGLCYWRGADGLQFGFAEAFLQDVDGKLWAFLASVKPGEGGGAQAIS